MTEVDLKPAAADQSGDFSSEQKRYLEGFVAGVQIAKAAKSVAFRQQAARPPRLSRLDLTRQPSKRRIAFSPPAKSFPIRKSSSASSIPSTATSV
jgi:acyl-homoserine lactone acylase PvdQ